MSATLTPASKCECGVRANTGARQAPDASSSLAIRSSSLVTQLGEYLSYKEEVAGSSPAEATKLGERRLMDGASIF